MASVPVTPRRVRDRARGVQPWAGRQWDGHLHDVVVAGRRMRYLDVGAGPVVVLIHGLGASWQVWYPTIPALATDHRVIAVDLPGFGRSESLRHAATIALYTAAVHGLLVQIGVRRAVVVGHSLGGLVTQRLAISASERVAGLMLVASGDGRVDVRQEAAFRGAAMATRALRVWGPPAYVVRPAVRALLAVAPIRQRLLSRAVHDPHDIPLDLAAHMMLSVYRSPALAGAIRAGLSHSDRVDLALVRCPTVVVSGDRDRMVPAVAALRLALEIPDARHEVWPDVGHHPMLERPEEFNALLCGFVAEVLGDKVPE